MDRARWSLRHFLDKDRKWHFHSTSNEVIWPKKFSNSMHGSKSAILAICQTRLGWPSRIPHWISNILFASGVNDFLAMLEGKIREGPFFKVQSSKTTVWKDKVAWKKKRGNCNEYIWSKLWHLSTIIYKVSGLVICCIPYPNLRHKNGY